MKKYITIISLLFFISNIKIYSQENFNISLGIGFPELLNIGIHLENNQIQYGLNYGTLFLDNEQVHSILGDVKFHFGSASEYSELKAWYFLLGMNYYRSELSTQIHNYLYATARIGREFMMNKNIGISFNIGIVSGIYEKIIYEKYIDGPIGGVSMPVLFPSADLNVFYRF